MIVIRQPVLQTEDIKYLWSKGGFSLVEVMFALLLLLFIMLGLFQTALVSVDSNMINILRDEGIRIVAERMEETRSIPFEDVESDTNTLSSDCPSEFRSDLSTGPPPLERDFRNISDYVFCTNLTCQELDTAADGDCATDDGAESKQVRITIGWQWKDEEYRHSATTLLRR